MQLAKLPQGSLAGNPLVEAQARVAEKRGRLEADRLLHSKVLSDRKTVAAEAVERLNSILNGLLTLVLAEAPDAKKLADSDLRLPFAYNPPPPGLVGAGVELGEGYLGQLPFRTLSA